MVIHDKDLNCRHFKHSGTTAEVDEGHENHNELFGQVRYLTMCIRPTLNHVLPFELPASTVKFFSTGDFFAVESWRQILINRVSRTFVSPRGCTMQSGHPPAARCCMTGMNNDENEDQAWRDLCERASRERDPDKLMELVYQIDRTLERREQRLRKAGAGKNSTVQSGS